MVAELETLTRLSVLLKGWINSLYSLLGRWLSVNLANSHNLQNKRFALYVLKKKSYFAQIYFLTQALNMFIIAVKNSCFEGVCLWRLMPPASSGRLCNCSFLYFHTSFICQNQRLELWFPHTAGSLFMIIWLYFMDEVMISIWAEMRRWNNS